MEIQLDKVLQNKLSNLIPKAWTKHEYYIKYWSKFFKSYKGSIDDTILDYGCGPGWFEFTGKQFGFTNILSLDVIHYKIAETLGIKFNTYANSGKVDLPFKDDSIDAVVSRLVLGSQAAYMKYGKEWAEIDRLRAVEFGRILKENAYIYIIGKRRLLRFKESLDKTNSLRFLEDKNIVLVNYK